MTDDDLRPALLLLERLTPESDPAAALDALDQSPEREATRWLAVVGAAAVVLAAAVGIVLLRTPHGDPAAGPAAATTSATANGVTTELSLSAARVTAGAPLVATVRVTNSSGYLIPYGDASCGHPFRFALVNLTTAPRFPAGSQPVGNCLQDKTLPVGQTVTFRVQVITAVPPGTYRTFEEVTSDLRPGVVPVPDPIQITVTKP